MEDRRLLLLILLAALFLRLYRLGEIPPGLTHDEADTGYFVTAIYRGGRSPVEAPYGYAYQPFTMYSGAVFMALFGPNDLALRLHSAFWGSLLVLFTYLWGRQAFGPPVGLGGAALAALSFWTVCDSRFALNSSPLPALLAGAAFFLWRALEGEGRPRWGMWALFTLFLAASFYVYEAAIAASAAFLLLLAHLALWDRPRFRRHAIWFAASLLLVGLLVAPHLLDPSSWGRTNTLSEPLRAALQGDLDPLLSNVVSALGTFSVRGDSFVTYNLPGRPIFDPLVSVFFYLGIGLCIYRWRQPAYAFTLLWLALGIVPSLVIGEWTSTLHSKAAETPIMILPALGAVETARLLRSRLGKRAARLFAAACVAWLAVVGAATGYDYFVRWGQSPATRAAYFHNLAAITDYVQDGPYSGVVAISSPFPDLPLDPLIGDLRVRRDDVTLRWFDGRRALLFPDAPESLLILPTTAPLDPGLAARVPLPPAQRIVVHPQDLDPTFDVVHWEPEAAWEAALGSLDGGTVQAGRPLSLPVRFGEAVQLIGYELETPAPAPGGVVRRVTAWQVLDPAGLGPAPPADYGQAASIFVHLLDGEDLVAQEDRLDVPAWGWQAGDRFLQVHLIPLGDDLPPGRYRLAVGIYTRHDLRRIPVTAGGEVLSDHLLLSPVEVKEP